MYWLYDKTDGQVLYKGKDVQHSERERTTGLQKRSTSQDPYGSLDPRMTVAEIVGEGIDIHLHFLFEVLSFFPFQRVYAACPL